MEEAFVMRMARAKGLAPPLQRLAVQRLRGGEVTLGLQQHAEVADGVERVRMPTAEGLAPHLQRLAKQRLGPVVLALELQLHSESTQGEDCCLATRALGLEPCTQQLEAQRIAVMVHALAAAVGGVLPRARAPPLLEAVHVDPHGGAAAGARLDERAFVFIPPALAARLLLHHHLGRGRRRSAAGPLRAICAGGAGSVLLPPREVRVELSRRADASLGGRG